MITLTQATVKTFVNKGITFKVDISLLKQREVALTEKAILLGKSPLFKKFNSDKEYVSFFIKECTKSKRKGMLLLLTTFPDLPLDILKGLFVMDLCCIRKNEVEEDYKDIIKEYPIKDILYIASSK